MLRKAPRWALVALLHAASTHASPPIEVLTARITGVPPGPPHEWHRIEFGLHAALPLPTAEMANTELGMNAGLTVTAMTNSVFGFGADIAYHYWPTSNEFKSNFNAKLRSDSWNTLELGGTTWRLSAIQVTAHVRAVAPISGPLRPWAQLAVGVYHVDPNTRGYRGPAGFFFVDAPPLSSVQLPGYSGSIGIDFKNSSNVGLGLHASYDHIKSGNELGSDFVAFSIGGHVRYGR